MIKSIVPVPLGRQLTSCPASPTKNRLLFRGLFRGLYCDESAESPHDHAFPHLASLSSHSTLGESPGYSQRHLWRPQPYKSPGRKTSTGTPQLVIDNRLARIPLSEVFQIVVARVGKEDCGELHIPDDLYGTRIDKKLCEHD